MAKWSDKEAAIKALERNGRVDPLDLIEAARDPSHPCHDDFTWDVTKAAHERWRDQARAIIRKCKFEVIVEEVGERVVHYVPSPQPKDDVFISLRKLRSKANTGSVLYAEVVALHGIASRCYGIALAKQNIVGASVVRALASIRDEIAGVRDDLE